MTNLLPISRTQAYIAIVEDALDQLTVLGDIAPDVGGGNGGGGGGGKGGVDKPSGEEISRILKDQRALEMRFQDLIMDQEKLKVLPNKTNSCKEFKAHPSVAQNLLKIQSERSSLQALLSKTVRELRELRFESLVVTVEEEKKKRNTLQNTINSTHIRKNTFPYFFHRENEASELQRELQKELANERKLLEEETNERNQVIQQLKDTIQEINALTNSEQKYIKKETKAHENSVKQRCQARETFLAEDQLLKNKCVSQEDRAHEKIVDYLTRQRNTLEIQIQEWMTKYEEDTEAKANELDALKQKRTQDLDKFEELVAAYEELEKIVEEDRQNKQREAEERRVMHERMSAAMAIQRWWRKMRVKLQKQASTKSAKKTPKKGREARRERKRRNKYLFASVYFNPSALEL
ncbi:hypothetical protein BC829DRAFT_413822 [Chytridium lagenaria]|nr:hypothetical protein BC829DRAFT_413822 [Chytridium lagenaria]